MAVLTEQGTIIVGGETDGPSIMIETAMPALQEQLERHAEGAAAIFVG
jgi:hypothetical protein